MRRYLKIGDNVLPKITEIKIDTFFRSEDRKTTLSGGLAVDRGNKKIKITAKFRPLSLEEVAVLDAAADRIVNEAEFYLRGQLAAKNMIANPINGYTAAFIDRDETRPVYLNVKLELEEV